MSELSRRRVNEQPESWHIHYAGGVRVGANVDVAETWFEENDPEGVAFEYEVLE